MLNIISLIQSNTEELSRLVSVLSIGLITIFGLLCLSLYKAYKLEKEITRLKSQKKL